MLFRFLEGDMPDQTGDLSPGFEELGAIAARCHAHTQTWAKPEPFERLTWDVDAVFGANPTWGNWRDAPNVTADIRPTLEAVEATIRTRLAAKNRRLFAVPDMFREFRQLVARHRGEVSAEVTSAEPLSDSHIAALKQALTEKLGKDVELEKKVDPSLIGGLVVRVGSRMIDTSLKTKLNSLKLAMKEVR